MDEEVNVIEDKGNGLIKVTLTIFGLAIVGLGIGAKKLYNNLSKKTDRANVEINKIKTDIAAISVTQDTHAIKHNQIVDNVVQVANSIRAQDEKINNLQNKTVEKINLQNDAITQIQDRVDRLSAKVAKKTVAGKGNKATETQPSNE